jgi:hypothetical protein
MLTEQKERATEASLPDAFAIEAEELRAAARRQAKRVRRLKIHLVAWLVGSALITGLWVLNQWQANGAFEHFGSHEGNPGDWNPTLWALGVGIWGLVVGIKALRVHFERPPTVADIEREARRLGGGMADAKVRRPARVRLERIGRLKFHFAAWALGMVVLTPLWALIEWQDNGGFERFSGNGEPGNWEPWIFYVGGIWAFVIALFALYVYLARPETDAVVERLRRLRPR